MPSSPLLSISQMWCGSPSSPQRGEAFDPAHFQFEFSSQIFCYSNDDGRRGKGNGRMCALREREREFKTHRGDRRPFSDSFFSSPLCFALLCFIVVFVNCPAVDYLCVSIDPQRFVFVFRVCLSAAVSKITAPKKTQGSNTLL